MNMAVAYSSDEVTFLNWGSFTEVSPPQPSNI